MFVTVSVILCLQVAPGPLHLDTDCAPEEQGVEEIVTDSSLAPDLDFFGCMLGQAAVVKWKSENPLYHSDRWRIARIRCVPGRYEVRGRA